MANAIIAANVVIFVGYVGVAIFFWPFQHLFGLGTKISASIFFLLCGLTHIELALHIYAAEQDGWSGAEWWGHVVSWHMLAIHVPQAISVVMFFAFLWRDLKTLAAERD